MGLRRNSRRQSCLHRKWSSSKFKVVFVEWVFVGILFVELIVIEMVFVGILFVERVFVELIVVEMVFIEDIFVKMAMAMSGFYRILFGLRYCLIAVNLWDFHQIKRGLTRRLPFDY